MINDDRWRSRLRRVFRLPTNSSRARRELDDELRFHLDGRIEELIAQAQLTRTEAEREARRRFGDYESYRNETRHIDERILHRRRKMELIDTILRETRHALRSLRRAPAFTVVAILTLALGAGATTAIFTLLDRVVLRPLPYANADRLLHVGTRWPGMKPDLELGISTYMFFNFRSQASSLENVGLYRTSALPLPATDGADAEQASVAVTSASLFNVLGIKPELGHLYTDADERALKPAVVVLSHDIWARRYASDRKIIGRMIDIGQGSVQVIGVLPADVKLPDANPALWMPDVVLKPTDPPHNWHTFTAIAKLKPGATLAQASTEISTLTKRMVADYPNVYGDNFMKKTHFAAFAESLRDNIVGPSVVRALWIVFGSVGIVLLIAAANVSNLFLVRIDSRRREEVVRSALGADRSHLAVHYLAESCVLALAGAVGAIAIAQILLRFALRLAPTSLPRLDEVHLDWRSIAFCIGVSVLAGVFFGILPLARRVLDFSALRDAARSVTTSRSRLTVRQALIASQVALAAVLLASAGLMLRSFQKLHAVQPGFDANNVVTMSIALPQPRYKNDAQLVTFWHDLQRGIEALPGVVSVGGSEALPFEDDGSGCTGLTAPDSPLEPSQRYQCLPEMTVSPGYFRTMRIPVHGHDEDWDDEQRGAGNVVVSQALANRMWPGESAIGKTLVYSVRRPITFTVSGVAEDVRFNGLQKPPAVMAYFPIAAPATAGPSQYADLNGNFRNLVIRTTRPDPESLGPEIRQLVVRLDSRVPVAGIQLMTAVVAHSIAQTSFTMVLLLLSSFIALSLSAAGIYGVISYVVAQRRTEIGIRMALGARSQDVSRMVVSQSLGVATIGIVAGVAAALMGTRLLRSLLFEVTPTDTISLAASCVVLIAVTLAASFAPARRASRIDPVEAMRS